MPNVAAVLFDLDDTLVDHSSAMREAAGILAREAGVGIPEDQFYAQWKSTHAAMYPLYLRGEISHTEMCRRRIWTGIGKDLSAAAADSLFARYMAHYYAAWKLYDDVLPCLAALRGKALGIVSNGRSVEQRAKVDVLGIGAYFTSITISEEAGAAKPSAGIFQAACSALRASPGDTVLVGDNYETDCLGATAAGLTAIWLDRFTDGARGTHGARMRTLYELPDILSKMEER